MCELKGLEVRDWIHDKESDMIKNLLGGKVAINVSASMIAKHSEVKEEEEGGKLLVNDM